jgi:feruloyl esterase
MKQMLWLFVAAVAAATLPAAAQAQPAPVNSVAISPTCGAMRNADVSRLPEAPTQVTSVRSVVATEVAPALCEVNGTIAPNVGFTLLMPEAGWNGKYFQSGCGNWCGVRLSSYYAKTCEKVVKRGYACMVTDAGHVARSDDVALTDGQWAQDNVQAELDWGGRASHVASIAGKALTTDFYEKAPARAYFMGCSYGGHQAMVLAQRYPWDFDGIVGGGAPNSIANLMQQNLWAIRHAYDSGLKSVFSEADLKLLHNDALAKCDMDDGLRDGLIGNPRACRVNPRALVCKAGQTSDCLSQSKADVAAKMYSGPTDSRGRKLAYDGWAPGTEMYWGRVYRSDGVGLVALAPNYFRYMARIPDLGAGWSMSSYDFDTDYRRQDVTETLYAAANPDLRRFKAAGGKFINYVGWHDMGTLPSDAIDYYDTVERTMGGRAATQDFFRMFMVPGSLHCRGGDGAEDIDFLSYLEAWVEQGKAPSEMIGAHRDASGAATFTRPTYPYPLMAKYRGKGDPNAAASFRPVPMR